MRQLSLFTAVLTWHLFQSTVAKTTSSEIDFESLSLCRSTTINYITQTLPQQCLRTDWSRPGTNTTTAVDHVPSTAEQPTTPPSPPSGASPSASTSDGFSQEVTSTEKGPEAPSSQVPSSVVEEARPSSEALPDSTDEDGDPLSDHGTFLSFEEWKAQMLEKAGQSPDHVVGVSTGSDGSKATRRQPGIENVLESLGDEGEIELDFSGFVSPESAPHVQNVVKKEPDIQEENDVQPPVKRSKEAGTTSKERFNYASFDCAATVLKTNAGSKGATWILSENKDSYLLNQCSQQSKYFIVELCNDILIDTIVLGNFEFFSSTFRHFRVSISDRYPVKADKWREIGTFEARNTRGVQAFLVENGLIWARYLKVELLTHYGKEYYCPVSLLRVHGKTMIDDYRNEMKEAHEQDDADDEEEAAPETEGQAEEMKADIDSILPIAVTSEESAQAVDVVTPTSTVYVTIPYETQRPEATSNNPQVSSKPESAPSSPWRKQNQVLLKDLGFCSHTEAAEIDSYAGSVGVTEHLNTVTHHKPSDEVVQGVTSPTTFAPAASVDANSLSENFTSQGYIPTTPTAMNNNTAVEEHSTASISITTTADAQMINTSSQTSSTQSTSESRETSRANTVSSPASSSSSASAVATGDGSSSIAESKPTNSTSVSAPASGTSVKSKGSKSSVPAKTAPSVPATQDSFFRSVHKRLQMLESNSTLSLQYIEEQSRILREAFSKAEKRQLSRTSNFLESLNSTVLGELRNFRTQYDQIWQSTVLELASQREQSQKEVRALGDRLGLLADELVWQKRVVYLQFILLVLCLGLVIFGKNGISSSGATAAPLELSLLQSIQHLRRGGSGLSVSFAERYPSSPESPPGTPSRPDSMGSLFPRKGMGHRRYLSDGITSGEETGIGTEVTTSPEQKRANRLADAGKGGQNVHLREHVLNSQQHVRNISDETTLLASDARSKSPSIDINLPTPASEVDDSGSGAADSRAHAISIVVDGDVGSEGDDETAILDVDPLALKRAASSPALGRQGEMAIDDDGQDSAVVEDDFVTPADQPHASLLTSNQ